MFGINHLVLLFVCLLMGCRSSNNSESTEVDQSVISLDMSTNTDAVSEKLKASKPQDVNSRFIEGFYNSSLRSQDGRYQFRLSDVKESIVYDKGIPYFLNIKGRRIKNEDSNSMSILFRFDDGSWITLDEYGTIQFEMGESFVLDISDYCSAVLGMKVETLKTCFPDKFLLRTENEIKYHGLSIGIKSKDQTLNFNWGKNLENVSDIRLVSPS